MHPGDEEEQEANEMKPDSKLKEKKVRPIYGILVSKH